MAEKYGVVPPKFSKEWWPYFWEYYKIHTIAAVFIIIAVVTTAVQCATKEKFDLTVTYAGNIPFASEQTDEISLKLEEFIEDIDANGEKNIFFQTLTMSDASENAEYNMAIQTKLMLEFQNERSYIFLLNDEQLHSMFDENAITETFVPVDTWVQDTGDELTIEGDDGKVHGVDVSHSRILNELGIKSDKPIYALLKICTKDGDEKAAYESSVAILKELTKTN